MYVVFMPFLTIIYYLNNFFQVFFSVMFGAMQLGQAGPNFNDVVTARGAAYQVFQIIDRVKV